MTLFEALDILELDIAAARTKMLSVQFRWLVAFYHPDNVSTGNAEELKRIVEAHKIVKENL